ncbi:MAG: hypothetical protein JXA82_14230 [Sedimentisphaerales bacterium]|nr:hypothetical protein [Sedimentisphaerales bacterium]
MESSLNNDRVLLPWQSPTSFLRMRFGTSTILNVVVLKGCTIGRGTVVAANSVVAGSLPAGVLTGGMPARVIRELNHGR